MKTAVILNLPFKAIPYDENEISNFEKWIQYFASESSEVIVTPPVERNDIKFSANIMNLNNITIIHVSSFDTCDRWKAGLLKALDNNAMELFYFWSSDFEFNSISKKSAEKLLKNKNECDLIIGTIQATGNKEKIDTIGTIPLLENWFYHESQTLFEKKISKPRSELLRISRELALFLLSKRWYPSEQTINIILQCLWNSKLFSMQPLPLGQIKDEVQSRQSQEVIQQIERMELWLKYMWREYNRKWSANKYLTMSDKSSKIVKNANSFLLNSFESNKSNDKSENYRFIVDSTWKDIHHSRNQDWTSLGVVFGAHIGIFQLINYFTDKISSQSVGIYYVLGGLVGIILSVIGALIAYRHRDLSKIKIDWIREAEDRIGLLKTEKNPFGVVDPKKYKGISNSWLIITIYVLFALIDLTIIAFFIKSILK
jgi:hypothetical protein